MTEPRRPEPPSAKTAEHLAVPTASPTTTARTVAAHETRALLRSPVHVLLWLAFAALLVHAVASGATQLAQERADLDHLVALDEERLAQNAELHVIGRAEHATFAERLRADPHWIGLRYGARHAVLPPLGAGALALPDDPLEVDAVLVTSARLDLARDATTTANPTLLGLGALDPAFALAWLLPLVALAFAFGLLSEERERGTAVLLFAAPVSVGAVLLGKLVPRFVALVVPGALAAAWAAHDPGDDQAFARAAVAAVAVAAFCAVWLLAAAALDLGRATSSTVALALAGLWLVAAVGLPAATDATWALLDDAPSAATQVAVEREAIHRAESDGDALLDAFLSDHPELAARADAGRVAGYKRAVWARTERVEELVAPILAERRAAERERTRFEAAAAALSPVTALERVFDVLAGRDAARREHFLDAVAAHHERWRSWFLDRSLRTASLEPEELADAPRFTWTEPPLRDVLARCVPALGGLAAQIALLFAIVARRRGGFAVLARSTQDA